MALGADMTSELWPLGGVNYKISYSKGFLTLQILSAKWCACKINLVFDHSLVEAVQGIALLTAFILLFTQIS